MTIFHIIGIRRHNNDHSHYIIIAIITTCHHYHNHHQVEDNAVCTFPRVHRSPPSTRASLPKGSYRVWQRTSTQTRNSPSSFSTSPSTASVKSAPFSSIPSNCPGSLVFKAAQERGGREGVQRRIKARGRTQQ